VGQDHLTLTNYFLGSMPPHSKCLEDEGAMIVAFKLVEKDQFMEEGITEILQSPGKVSFLRLRSSF
jgi:N-methylhydantoinase B/oxoprolinase/acetone carboxylase alpha subunit